MIKLNIWNSKIIKVRIKIKLMHTMITSLVMYGCESWTFSKCLESNLCTFEMHSFQYILGISFWDDQTNTSIYQEITDKAGPFEPLLKMARRKLQWFEHMTWHPGTLVHIIMHGTVEGRRQGRHRMNRLIQSWTGKRITECNWWTTRTDGRKWYLQQSAPMVLWLRLTWLDSLK